MSTVIDPFAGEPRTIHGKDRQGRPVLKIRARALTPLRAKLADALTALSTAALTVGSVHTVGTEAPSADWALLAAAIGPVLTFPLQRLWIGNQLKAAREMRMTADRFSVRTALGWKHYNRQLPHSFALLRHDKTEEELIRQEFEARQAEAKGQIIRKTRYYAESFHLVFVYMGQRVDVMSIYKQKDAEKILSRLNVCDAVIDAGLGQGKGTAIAPEDDWAQGPGSLPQD